MPETFTEPNSGPSEHLRLVRGEISADEYVAQVKDRVDRRLKIHAYRPENEAAAIRKPSLLRRLGNLYIEAFNPYRDIE